MGACDPDVGCRTVAELSKFQAVHGERLKAAADQAEDLVLAFKECLNSVQVHALDLRDGNRRMESIERGITEVTSRQHDHETAVSCMFRDHEQAETGLHRMEAAAIGIRFDTHMMALKAVGGGLGIVGGIVAISNGELVFKIIGRWVGAI